MRTGTPAPRATPSSIRWPGRGRRAAGRVSARAWARGWRRRRPAAPAGPAASTVVVADQGPQFELASNDPLVGYLLSAAGAVDIRGLDLDSPALADAEARPASCSPCR